MKSLFSIVLSGFLLVPLWPAAAAEPEQPKKAAVAKAPAEAAPPLEDLVAEALAQNPEIKASEAQWRMFVEQTRQAGVFADPMLMLGINNGLVSKPLDFKQDEMTSKVIGLSQEVPFFGKRALAKESARLEAKSWESRYQERKLELTAMVKETYARIFFIDRALDIVERNIRILDDVIRAAETRYTVGQGIQQDVLKAQVERSKMVDMQITLQQQRRTLTATMNRLLYRPAGTAVGEIPELQAPAVGLSAEDLESLAERNRPLIQGLTAQVDKGKTERDLAKKEFYPDFNFSLEYMLRESTPEGEGLDMYSAGVTLNLPVRRDRRHARVAETEAQIRMAQAELNNLRNTIHTGIADFMAQLERGQRQISLYRTGIIPQATRSFEAARAAYQNNQVDFLSMLDSLLTLFNYERDYYDVLSDYRMNLARLEALVGHGLPVEK